MSASNSNIEEASPEILAKVAPAPWKESRLFSTKETSIGLPEKICGIVRVKLQIGGGGASLPLCVSLALLVWDSFTLSPLVLGFGKNNPVNWGGPS